LKKHIKNRTFHYIAHLMLYILLALVLQGCKISYSFSGASIPPEVKTVSVQYFPNRASNIQPTLSNTFTNALKDKIQSQTNLILVNEDGDVNFEGEIQDYYTKPIAITKGDEAAKNRLTIKVRVRYENSVDEKQNFNQTFSRYEDYESSKSLSSVESQLIEEIVDLLTDDVFNKAFVNW
jgi:hypothetical protein